MTKPTPTRNPAKQNVLIVDDHPLLREGVAQLIDGQPDLMVSGQAGSPRSAMDALSSARPDLLLLDLRLGQGDGIEFVKVLHARYPDLRILVMSQLEEEIYAERALRAGAKGFIMKEEASETVLTAIRAILRGEIYLSTRLSGTLLQRFLTERSPTAGSTIESLSDRELHIFQLIGEGLSAQEIASHLNVSIKTVHTHRENIKHKLALASSTELIRHAAEWLAGRALAQAREATNPKPVPSRRKP